MVRLRRDALTESYVGEPRSREAVHPAANGYMLFHELCQSYDQLCYYEIPIQEDSS